MEGIKVAPFYLLGELREIQGDSLPTNADMLRSLLYYMNIENKSVAESSICTLEKCRRIWEVSEITVETEENSFNKLNQLAVQWSVLQVENEQEVSEEHLLKEFQFEIDLRKIFDIRYYNISGDHFYRDKLIHKTVVRRLEFS